MMRHAAMISLFVPAIALAEATIQTEFPNGSVQVAPEELKKRLTGNAFIIKPASDPEMRVQYKDEYVFINFGRRSDSGRWRIEGSSVCFEWRNLTSGCSEIRIIGNSMYTKRTINGEIVELLPN